MMRNLRLTVMAAALGGAILWHGLTAHAEEAAPPLTNEQRIEELDQKVRILERRAELDKEAAETKAKETPTLAAGKDGFILKSGDGNFRLRIGALVQADGRFFATDTSKLLTTTFELRRVRPIIEGTVFQYFDVRVIPDFGEGKAQLIDAYLDVHYWPQASLKLGKFKPPVGLERLQSANDIRFVERALPTNLVPNRDVGVHLYGDVGEGILSYALGLFNGVPDGASGDLDSNDDKDLAARVFVHPFKKVSLEPLQRLGIGVAGTYGSQDGALPSYKSGGQQTFFSYKGESKSGLKDDAKARGERFRISPQAYYYWGPFGVLAEYVISSQRVSKDTVQTVDNVETRTTKNAKIANSAWQLAATYLLTGEQSSYKGVQPTKPFVLGAKGWGAWEVAARYNQLDVDKDVFKDGFADPAKSAKEAKAWAVGLNWYLNKNFKLALDYERTGFEGGRKKGDRASENAVLMRFQLGL